MRPEIEPRVSGSLSLLDCLRRGGPRPLLGVVVLLRVGIYQQQQKLIIVTIYLALYI